MTAPSARLLGLLLAALSLPCATAACGSNGDPKAPPPAKEGEALPEDMSTTSLVGGGLIAGDSIAALATGIAGLLSLGKGK